MILTLLLVALAMAAQDFLATGMTVAEAKDRALWAGTLDALNDVASRVGMVVTASIVTKQGWSREALAALGVTAGTSFVTTNVGTRFAHRLLDDSKS